MKVKKMVALAMASVMTLSTVACGNTETASQSAGETTTDAAVETASGVPTYASIKLGEDYTDLTATIKFIHHKTDREADGTIPGYIAEFNKMYPNITVETEGVTDYAEDSLLRLSAGDWGDVMFIPAVDKADLDTYFLPYGTVEEMSELVNFPNNWAKDGMCYGIGYMGNAQGVLYNTRIFEEAGITELPKTPDEFLDDLQLIKDNTDAIPLYTNYAAGWTMGAWDAYIGITTEGNDAYFNQQFVHDPNPFDDNGTGSGIYNLYKILYEATARGLIEDDYTTTDWEGCKAMINNGDIATMVLGSWAVAQMKAAGDHPDEIGYMPFPISVNSQQYASAGPDYCYGINAKASVDNQIASMVFVKWMTDESGWCEFEGGYPISLTAPTTFDFSAATILSDLPAVEGEEDFLNEMNAESELAFNAGGNSKVQYIIEAASTGSESFDDIMQSWSDAWSDAQEELGITVDNQ